MEKSSPSVLADWAALARLEQQWIADHKAQYAGRWVALDGDRLLAEAASAAEVYAEVRGIRPAPLVVHIEADPLPFAGW